MSILITFPPVLGKCMITLPSTMITMITLPRYGPGARAPALQHRPRSHAARAPEPPRQPTTPPLSVQSVISVTSVTHLHEVGPLGRLDAVLGKRVATLPLALAPLAPLLLTVAPLPHPLGGAGGPPNHEPGHAR